MRTTRLEKDVMSQRPQGSARLSLGRGFLAVLTAFALAFTWVALVPQDAADASPTASISGTVLDGNGASLFYGGAFLCPGTSIPPNTYPSCTQVYDDGAGAYSFDGLEAGTYTLDGFGSFLPWPAGVPTTVTLTEGEAMTGVNFVLGSRIEGHVTDPGGAAVSGATVRVKPDGIETGSGVVAYTDTNGDYLSSWLGAGTFTVSFVNADGTLIGEDTVVVAPNSTPTLDIQLHAAAIISGSVLDGDGQPLPFPSGACIGTADPLPPGACGVWSDGTGAYSVNALEAGTYTVDGFGSAGSAATRAGTPVTLTLAEGEVVTDVNFVLGSRIEGHVTDPGGAAVAGATVRLEYGGPVTGEGDVATTDANGYYITPYLGPGTFTVRFTDAGGTLIAQETVEVSPNSTATLDSQLYVGARIEATVLGDGGAVPPGSGAMLCPGSTVVVFCPGFSYFYGDGAGEGTLQPLMAGTYSVAGFEVYDPATPTVVLDVAAGDVVTCEFTLGTSPAASCSGATGGDGDDDGVPGSVEDGAPNGGDGNNDGTADSAQANVTSLPNAVDGQYVTVASPDGTSLTSVEAIDPATLPAPPAGAQLPAGVVSFEVHGVGQGASVPVEVLTPAGTNPNSYFKFQNSAWVDFTANASFSGDVVTLTLTDGGAGDADGTANGVIVDPGAPGIVTFDFSGFFAPVDNPPAMNTVKAGRAIPIKFSLNGDQGLDIFADGYPASARIHCDGTPFEDGMEEAVTAGNRGLKYHARADRYRYVWKTDKAWSGQCRQFVLRLTDGSEHVANFKFPKGRHHNHR